MKLLLFTAILVGVTWIMASYRGLPWTAIIVAAVLLIYNFILNKTRLGRSIYAIGGNAEAAELSGINVRRVTFMTFCSMSMLAALSGILTPRAWPRPRLPQAWALSWTPSPPPTSAAWRSPAAWAR